MNKTFCLVLLILSFLTVALGSVSGAQAQIPVSTEKAAASEKVETAKDPYGRDTPRSAMRGFLDAVADENYDEAAKYLDTSALSREQKKNPAILAQNLQRVLDRHGWVNADGSLSDKPEGHVDDEAGENADVVATIRTESGTTPIELRRVEGENGALIWLISADFVAQIPELSNNTDEALIDRVMIGELGTFKVHGAPVGHWAAMIALYVAAYLISGVFVRGFIRIVRAVFRRRNAAATPSEHHLINEFQTPLRLYTMVWIAAIASIYLGISIIVRQNLMPIGTVIAWIAVGIFFWRLADLIVSAVERRIATRELYNLTSILSFARRMLKFVFVIIILILVLSSFGVDVTAGLAALGIGGIALALGAQKTLENFIGSLSIVADQPFRVGDFCKIGDVSGTVEDIGMRSTRLRTNDRTLVTIPNGDLSTQRIENFARRSRFLMNKKLILRYDATSEQIRDFIGRVQMAVDAEEKIVKEGTIVRFQGFVDNGHLVEFWANIDTGDFNEFLAVQARVMLATIDAARDSGVYFAIPSQTFVPAKDQTGNENTWLRHPESE